MKAGGRKGFTRGLVALSTIATSLICALPSAAAGAPSTDSCNYAANSFTESTVMRWGQINGSGMSAQLVGFANDEKGLLLGVDGATALSSATSNGTNSYHASNALGGSATATDPSGRPFFPALYITDLTTNPLLSNGTGAGDFQNGGSPRNINSSGHPFVDDIFGAWSTASTSGGKYTATIPSAKNDWNLGTGSNTPTGTTFSAMGTEGYGSEVRWNISGLKDNNGQPLMPGHTYRFQIITHDGDQNKSGGDAGEFCTTLSIPGTPGISVLKLQRDGSTGSFTHQDITITEPAGSYVVHTIEYEIQAKNTGDEPLDLSLNDPLCDSSSVQGPTSVSGKLVGSTLYPGGVAQYTCSHALLQGDPSPFTNVATVYGKPPTGPSVHGTSQVTAVKHSVGAKQVKRCRTARGRIISYQGSHKPAACMRVRKPAPSRHPRRPSGFTG